MYIFSSPPSLALPPSVDRPPFPFFPPSNILHYVSFVSTSPPFSLSSFPSVILLPSSVCFSPSRLLRQRPPPVVPQDAAARTLQRQELDKRDGLNLRRRDAHSGPSLHLTPLPLNFPPSLSSPSSSFSSSSFFFLFSLLFPCLFSCLLTWLF